MWQKASLFSSCPWLLLSGSAMDFWGKTSGLLCQDGSSSVSVTHRPSEEMASRVGVLLGLCKAQRDLGGCTSTGLQLWHVSQVPQYTVQQQRPLAPLVNLCLLISCRGGGIWTSEAVSFLSLVDL